VKRVVIVIGMVLASAQAYAADGVQLADNNVPGPHFLSLASERDGTAQLHTKDGAPVPSPAMRSDRDAMGQGYMRIDRARNVPVAAQHALILPGQSAAAKAADDGPRIIRGTQASLAPDSEEPRGGNTGADPVLSLFSGAEQGTLQSFNDALRVGHPAMSSAAMGSVGKQAWPVSPTAPQKISSGYGARRDPLNGRPEFHGGIDIAAASGTPVLATAEATVTKVGEDANYGKFITLAQAGGIESHYGHLSVQDVKEGDHVNPGQVIGAVGATGRTTGAHLDYRISLSGAKIDPMTVLTAPAGVTTASATPGTNPIALDTPVVTAGTSYRPVTKPIHDMQVKVVTVN
jgi:hypothetical protein